MQVYKYPDKKDWPYLLQRPVMEQQGLDNIVREILSGIKADGDHALEKYTKNFDKVELDSVRVSTDEIDAAEKELDTTLKDAILLAYENIKKFHQAQVNDVMTIETMPGVTCWRKSLPIEKVGLYIPGGTAPLFSTILMLGIPATIAGCSEIILCSPPSSAGKLHPAILFTAKLVGVTKIFKAGGVQAIGAMAYGTDSIPRVHKIFGPGNQYVTAAKQIVQQEGTAIDMPAGPSEVCVLADDSANASFVAADLLSQAEHGMDSQVLLVSTSEQLVADVQLQLEKQLQVLPRKDLATASLLNSRAIIVDDIDTAVTMVNEYAAEHLILSCANDEEIALRITTAGSVFLGHLSPESAGDYASGTNHTLPTNGYARSYSGVSVDSFVKKITYQKLNQKGLESIGPAVIAMAEAEGLRAHAAAVKIRLENN